MRKTVLLLATASLMACNRQAADATASPEGAEVTPAALSYDGADYGTDEAAKLAHGERLSHVLGCRGCHTGDLTGQPFPPEEEGFPASGIYASNLTQVLPTMDDAALRKLLVEGVHPTREKMWMMPSSIFQHLSDADLDALIAHLRTVEPKGEPTPLPEPSAAFLAEVKAGRQKPIAEEVVDFRNNTPADLGEPFALGRHIAMSTCAECHGSKLEGLPDFTPSLIDVAPMYDDAAFTALLTEGKGLEGRTLGLMALVGKGHFSYLTDRERKAVIEYVHALADKEAGQPQ